MSLKNKNVIIRITRNVADINANMRNLEQQNVAMQLFLNHNQVQMSMQMSLKIHHSSFFQPHYKSSREINKWRSIELAFSKHEERERDVSPLKIEVEVNVSQSYNPAFPIIDPVNKRERAFLPIYEWEQRPSRSTSIFGKLVSEVPRNRPQNDAYCLILFID